MKAPLPLSKEYDWLALISLATSLALIIYYFDVVPDRIPTHFNGQGEPDNWSGKNMLWFLPAAGLFMYIFLGLMALIPSKHRFSTMQPKVGEEAKVKSLSLEMTGALRAMISVLLAYLSWESIQIALENNDRLWVGALPLFLILIFGCTGYYAYEIIKRSK